MQIVNKKETLPCDLDFNALLEILRKTTSNLSEIELLNCVDVIAKCYLSIFDIELIDTNVKKVEKQKLTDFENRVLKTMCHVAVSYHNDFQKCEDQIFYALEPFLWQVAEQCEWKIPEKSMLGENVPSYFNISIE